MPQPNRLPHHRFRWPLVLALAVGLVSAGQALPAQSAPAGDYSYQVIAALDKGKTTLCLGDTVTAAVRVLLSNDDIDLGPIRSGLWVEGASQNPIAGNFVVDRETIGWNGNRPQEALFSFHAGHAGKTTLTFKAEVHYYKSDLDKWLYGPVEYIYSNPVDVTVVNCKYRVTTASLWKVPGEAYLAIMDWTNLTMDASGSFHGKGTARWSGFWQVVPPGSDVSCDTVFTGPASPVDLSAQPDQAGNLVLTIQFTEVIKPNWHAVCHADGGSTPPVDNPVRLAPEKLTVILTPNGSSSFKQTQQLTDAISGGLGRIVVIPVAGK